MSDAVVALPAPDTTDATITRVTRVLMAWHDVTVVELAAAGIASSKATMERRLNAGGYTAREVAALARAFGTPIESFYSGHVDLAATRCQWHPKRRGQAAPPSGLEPETCRFTAR